MGAKTRQYGLDFLKYVCCLLVIFIHMDLPSKLENVILPITRIAVPTFFMITGYFYSNICQKGREVRQIKKVVWLVLAANGLHLGWALVKVVLSGDSIVVYISEFFNKSTLVNFLVFQQPPYRTSLWYINALLVMLFLVYALQKAGLKHLKKLYPLIPILLAVNLLLGTYSPLFFDANIPLCYTRNFLFCGLPYFLLGDFINHYKIRLKTPFLIVGIIVFTCISVFEYCILWKNEVLLKADHLFGTFFLVLFVFVWFLKNEHGLQRKKWVRWFASLGAKYSFVIYIIHSILIEFWSKGIGVLSSHFSGLGVVLQYMGPFFILIASTLVAVIWDKLKARFWFFRKANKTVY